MENNILYPVTDLWREVIKKEGLLVPNLRTYKWKITKDAYQMAGINIIEKEIESNMGKGHSTMMTSEYTNDIEKESLPPDGNIYKANQREFLNYIYKNYEMVALNSLITQLKKDQQKY